MNRSDVRLQRAWALLLSGAALYIPANVFPVMTMTLPGHHDALTVWGGVMEFYHVGLWPGSIVIFLASMVVPLFKLVSVGWLLWMDGSPHYRVQRTKLFRFVETIGTWSMVDIFLLSVLVAVGQLGVFASVKAEPGALFFAAVMVCTIAASLNYDIHRIWQEEKA